MSRKQAAEAAAVAPEAAEATAAEAPAAEAAAPEAPVTRYAAVASEQLTSNITPGLRVNKGKFF